MCHGIGDGAAYAAAHYAYLFEPFGVCRHTQRPHKIMHAFTFLKRIELHGTGTHDLVDDGYTAFFAVKVARW